MGKIKMVLAMIIFGTIGIFINKIALPSAFVACMRAIVGTAFLAIILGFYPNRSNMSSIKKNAIPIILSGIALGFNWVFLFEAYKHTTVPVATACYNLAPVFVLIASPIVLRERPSIVHIACTLGALAGAVLISGIIGNEVVHTKGVIYAVAAAILYCAVMILSKKISGISSLDNTFYQMAVAAVVMTVYTVFTVDLSSVQISGNTGWMLLVLGIVHTGIAYALAFSASKRITAQSWGILSYIDPATAIISSTIILNQKLSSIEILGTAMIFGFVFINAFVKSKRRV